MSNATDTLMTASQVAERLGVPRSTVTRWARAGSLPSFRTPGKHYRFRRSEVEKFLPAFEIPEAS